MEWPELVEEKNKLEFYFKIIKNDIREINYKGFGNLKDLKIIEIQTGDCREDDIIRLEDDYGR